MNDAVWARSTATAALIRPETVRRHAREAGFADELQIEGASVRICLLKP
jgi:hypothetical protein